MDVNPTDVPHCAGGVVVAGHVCLDLIPAFPTSIQPVALRPGSLIEVGTATTATGGAVANTGIALHRLGVPVRLVGRIGQDWQGREVQGLLEAHGAGLAAGMSVRPDADTSYTVVVSPPGQDRMFLHHPGANHEFSAKDVSDAALRGAAVLHFGYPPLMRRVREKDGEELVELFGRAKQHGLATSLDMCDIDPNSEASRIDWRRWLNRVLPYTDLFLPSHQELAYMLGDAGEAPSAASLRRWSRACLDGGAAVVAIKLGDRGLYLRTGHAASRLARLIGDADPHYWDDRELYAPCFRCNFVGATGAGDATIAGLIANLIHTKNLEAALQGAVAAGGAGVEAADATSGVRPWAELQERIAAGWEQHDPIACFADWPLGPHGLRSAPQGPRREG